MILIDVRLGSRLVYKYENFKLLRGLIIIDDLKHLNFFLSLVRNKKGKC